MIDNKQFIEPKEKLEMLFKIISRYDFYINSTNSKASIIIAWNGTIIGSVLLKYNSIIALYCKPEWAYYISNIFLVGLAISGILSIVFVFKVVNPFLSSSDSKKGSPKSLIFFRDVSEITHEEYARRASELTYGEALSDSILQAHILATGLSRKMKDMQQSIWAINCGLLIIFLLIVLKGVIAYVR